MEIHISNNTTECVPYVKPVIVLFLNERDKFTVTEQTRFLCAAFLCSEFKLEDVYSEENFGGKNICGNFFFLHELIYADHWRNHKN